MDVPFPGGNGRRGRGSGIARSRGNPGIRLCVHPLLRRSAVPPSSCGRRLPSLPGALGLRPRHILGGLLGFSGCLLLISGGTDVSFRAENILGYAVAAGCALIWSGNSVAARRFDTVLTDTVGWFCGATAILAWDVGVKRRDLRLLGILSYAAPPTSGLLLVVAGQATLTGDLIFACIAIAAGAAIASWKGPRTSVCRTAN